MDDESAEMEGEALPPGVAWRQIVGVGQDNYRLQRQSGSGKPWRTLLTLNKSGNLTLRGTKLGLGGNARTRLQKSGGQVLEVYVNNQRALRLEPTAESPNLIGGYSGDSGNGVTPGVVGATIGGGGKYGYPNRVTDRYGTVAGGWYNRAGNDAGSTEDAGSATVGGGWRNTASGADATVGGGFINAASGEEATVGGGFVNAASGETATVGGGRNNIASGTSSVVSGGDTNTASGWRSTVPGGVGNTAAGEHSFAAGRRAKALHNGSFVWADSNNADFASDAADEFLVRAYNGVKIVRGASTFSPSQAALQVDQAHSAEAGWFYTTHASNAYAVLKVAKLPAAPGNFIDGVDRTAAGAETRKFHINRNGAFVAGSDFAESLPVAGELADYEPGDVLVISLDQPGAVVKCGQPYDSLVLGVYSTRPAVLGADKGGVTEVGADEIPVAVLGIVPVKVSAENGTIQPGDLLTTLPTLGHAMRCEGLERCFGRTLGKALEGLPEGQTTGVIRVLVSLQ
jgi:hypothetical protein